MKNSISQRQLFIITAIGFVLNKIYVMPAFLSEISNESLWVSALVNYILDFFLLLIVLNILNKTNSTNIFESISKVFSYRFSKFISIIFAIFFITKSFVPIFEQKNCIELTFYETQPTILTFMPFFIMAFYVIIKGYRAFGRSMEICLWFYVFAISVIFMLSIFAGRYSSLLPIIGENPIKIAKGSVKSLLWFGDPLYILFFSGYITNVKNNLKNIKFAYVISSVTVILFLVVFYAVFDTISPRQIFAPLKMSKYSIALSNIGRFDYIASFILASITVFQISLPLLFASNALNYAFNFKKKFLAPIIVVGIELAFSVLSQYDFFATIYFVADYLIYFFIVMTYVVPFIMYVKLNRRTSYDF